MQLAPPNDFFASVSAFLGQCVLLAFGVFGACKFLRREWRELESPWKSLFILAVVVAAVLLLNVAVRR